MPAFLIYFICSFFFIIFYITRDKIRCTQDKHSRANVRRLHQIEGVGEHTGITYICWYSSSSCHHRHQPWINCCCIRRNSSTYWTCYGTPLRSDILQHQPQRQQPRYRNPHPHTPKLTITPRKEITPSPCSKRYGYGHTNRYYCNSPHSISDSHTFLQLFMTNYDALVLNVKRKM